MSECKECKSFFCEGVDKAPQRSLFNALGMTKEELERPLVGIVSSYNEIVPGHMNIDKIVDAVKMGVAMAGGTPVVFPAIAVCDGIAMGHQGMKYSLSPVTLSQIQQSVWRLRTTLMHLLWCLTATKTFRDCLWLPQE